MTLVETAPAEPEMIQHPPRADEPAPAGFDAPDQVALRQLRHHTKNALQRLLCQVSACRGLQGHPAGRALMSDLERRIMLSATLSDALFGLVRAPRPLADRMASLAEAAVELMSDGDQVITTSVSVVGSVPGPLADILVRVAHELVGNAVKHGMHVRLVGAIAVHVQSGEGQVVLTVSDDGWGFGDCLSHGEGLSIARLLSDQVGGRLTLTRVRGRTVAELLVPHARELVR